MITYSLPNDTSLETLVGSNRTIGEAFEAILNWNTNDIRERLQDGDIIPASEIDEAIIECRKFFMCIVIAHATNARSVGMMSVKVDEVWHNAILFTKEYFQLSEQMLGEGRYLHHAPVVKSQHSNPTSNVFAQIYHQLFGRIPEIWGVRYEHEVIWENAMQGLCLVEPLNADCQAVCHPDSCNGCSGQLCNDMVISPVAVLKTSCDSPSCSDGGGCSPAPCYDTSCRG